MLSLCWKKDIPGPCLCSKKSSIMRPRTLSSFILSSPRTPVLQRAHHTRTRYLIHFWSIWQPWVYFPYVSKIQMAFSSLSVRALPKRKSKTTFQYKYIPNKCKIWAEKPLLATGKWFSHEEKKLSPKYFNKCIYPEIIELVHWKYHKLLGNCFGLLRSSVALCSPS